MKRVAKEATTMTTTKQAARREQETRIHAAHEEARRVWNANKCPDCGAGIRRNLSLTGWVQCEQLGAETHRKDPSKPSCRWQGFTE